MALHQKITMPMAFHHHRQPTLPHLLQEYGFQNQNQQPAKANEKAATKKTVKKESKKGGSFFPEDERDPDKERELDEHYLKMVRDMYHLRDYYYNEYSALLAEKVEKQRQEIRERDAKLRHFQTQKEEEERKASHRVKKRLERHTLDTTPVTESVPKTDLYYIVGLEDKLRRAGKLKTPSDFNKFRKDMNVPHIFYANFKVNKHSDFTRYSESTADWESSHSKGESNDMVFEMLPDPANLDNQQEQQLRALSRISESRESPVPTSKGDSWAVTQQFPAQHRKRRSLVPAIPSQTKTKSDQLSDLEKRFPKLEMPKLHCFSLNLNKKPPDPEEVRQQLELRAKEKGRRRAMRTYTKMYQLAMTNTATTSRIMDNFEDMNFILQGPDLCDVIADHHWMQAYGLTETDMKEEEEMPDMDQDENLVDESSHSRGKTPAVEGSPTQAMSRGGSAVSTKSAKSGSRKSRQSSAKSKSASPEEEFQKVIPLTLEEIRDDCDIKESRILSSLWNNYMKAGKSPWTKTEQ